MAEASTDERKVLKGPRWLLFKHSSNRSKNDSRILKNLHAGNRRIHRVFWVLKDEFEHFGIIKPPGLPNGFLNDGRLPLLKVGWSPYASSSERSESISNESCPISKND